MFFSESMLLFTITIEVFRNIICCQLKSSTAISILCLDLREKNNSIFEEKVSKI